ncbi:MAG: hypothetical protein V8R62_08560 [Faecalibacillus intestinalis]
MLAQEGLNVIGFPKTIDNDTWDYSLLVLVFKVRSILQQTI